MFCPPCVCMCVRLYNPHACNQACISLCTSAGPDVCTHVLEWTVVRLLYVCAGVALRFSINRACIVMRGDLFVCLYRLCISKTTKKKSTHIPLARVKLFRPHSPVLELQASPYTNCAYRSGHDFAPCRIHCQAVSPLYNVCQNVDPSLHRLCKRECLCSPRQTVWESGRPLHTDCVSVRMSLAALLPARLS